MGFNQEGGIYTGDTTGGQYEDDLPSQEFSALSRAEEAARDAVTAQLAAEAAQTAAELAQAAAEAAQASAETTAEEVTLLVAQAEAARDAAVVAKLAAQAAQAAAETAEDNAVIAQNAAASSASSASTSATSASTSASTATTQAGIATTQAGIATTQAINSANSASAASASASAAATAETNAETAETNAETAQAAAEAAQLAAETAQTAAELAETNAETAETNAETAATNAFNSASTATTQAGIATTKASEASTSASNAATSASAAEAARDQALAAFDNFDDKYLGEKASNPTVDNDGNALQTGALYFNTTVNEMRVYTGTVWVAAYVAGSGVLLATNNLSDVADVPTARTNLGLGTAATTDSTAYATAAQGALADTALQSYTETDPVFLASVAYGITSTQVTNWDTSYTDRLKWDGGATGLVAATGRTSLELGTAATTDSTAYATAAQGALADSAVQPASTNTLTNKVIDSITNTVGADHLHFKIKATEAITKGNVLKVTGYNSGEDAIEVAKVSSSSDIAVGVAHDTLTSGSFGALINTGLLEGVDTSAFTVGTVLYPNTSGGFTSTKPSSGMYQAIAYVLRSHAVNGTILIEATEPNTVLGTAATTDSSAYATAAQGALADTALQSYTETDPIYVASSWYTTTNNASNWNTAYGWGNHASAGYATTASLGTAAYASTTDFDAAGTAIAMAIALG